MPWSASVAVAIVSPFARAGSCELSRPSAKSDGGAQRDQAELVLPAQAVGLELVEQVEHREVVAELLARRALVEVLGAGLAPVERDALVLHERERGVDALVVDAAGRDR